MNEWEILSTQLKKMDTKRSIKRAKQLQQHIIVFDNNWDMEPCATPYQLSNLQWNKSVNGDEEWCFMLNRMEYLNHLLIAAMVEEDEQYLLTWQEYVCSWIKAHPVIQAEPSTRTLDTAIRCVAWLRGIELMKDRLDAFLITQIYDSIQKQFAYLKDSYISKYTLSNWGILQTSAILYGMPLLEKTHQDPLILSWAKEEFKIQCEVQIYDEGYTWEQSTMYHVEVLLYALLVYQRMKWPWLREKLQMMSKALYALQTPHHYIDAFGDSDQSDVCDILAACAMVLEDASLGKIEDMDPILMILYGFKEEAVKDSVNTQPTTYFANMSGWLTWRSDWSEQANFFQFLNGGVGSGHGHSDNQHFSLYHQGEPFFIDPGRYTYREDREVRRYLKSQEAHNTIVIDDDPGSIPDSSWTNEKFVKVIDLSKYECPLGIFVTSALLGYAKQLPYTHIRKCVILRQGIYIIVDELYMQGAHQAKTYFHMDSSIAIQQRADCLHLQGEKVGLSMYGTTRKYIWEMQPYAKKYNELEEHPVLIMKSEFQEQLLQAHIFIDPSITMEKAVILQDGIKEVAQSQADAWKFIIDEQESITVVVFHEEIYKGKKLFYCEGVALHGQCYVIHKSMDQVHAYRLQG